MDGSQEILPKRATGLSRGRGDSGGNPPVKEYLLGSPRHTLGCGRGVACKGEEWKARKLLESPEGMWLSLWVNSVAYTRSVGSARGSAVLRGQRGAQSREV